MAGKGVPAAHPYSVEVGWRFFNREFDGDGVGASRRGARPGLCVVIYGRCLYNINMCKNAKPQKSRFLRLTYFLTANFGDFEV